MMCLDVFLLGSNFFGTLWASWTSWKSISFARLGKFSFIICSNKFSISWSSSSPSGTPMIQLLECLKLSWRFLSLSSLFWFFFLHSVLVGCLFLPFVPNRWFESLLPPFTIGFLYILLYFPLRGLHFFILCPSSINSVSILITSVLNSASDRFSISLLLNSFLEFWYVLSFGPYFFVLVHLLCCKGVGP